MTADGPAEAPTLRGFRREFYDEYVRWNATLDNLDQRFYLTQPNSGIYHPATVTANGEFREGDTLQMEASVLNSDQTRGPVTLTAGNGGQVGVGSIYPYVNPESQFTIQRWTLGPEIYGAPEPVQHGDIIFRVGTEADAEVLRLAGDGTVSVRGQEVTSDEALVDGLRAFLRAAGFYIEVGGNVVVRAGVGVPGSAGRDTVLQVVEDRNAGK